MIEELQSAFNKVFEMHIHDETIGDICNHLPKQIKLESKSEEGYEVYFLYDGEKHYLSPIENEHPVAVLGILIERFNDLNQNS